MENTDKKQFQVSVNMDDDLKEDILKIAKSEERKFAVMAYRLLGQAVKERKRIAAKNARKKKDDD